MRSASAKPPFESAGPHFNPGNHKHGMLSGEGHAGDMPNLHVPQSGELSVEVLNAAVTLEKGKPNSLFDNDGSSLMIHAKADDYKTDPAGNAGGRIACGVIQPSGAGSRPCGAATQRASELTPAQEIAQRTAGSAPSSPDRAAPRDRIPRRPCTGNPRKAGLWSRPCESAARRRRCAPAARFSPAPPTMRTPSRPQTAARRAGRR